MISVPKAAYWVDRKDRSAHLFLLLRYREMGVRSGNRSFQKKIKTNRNRLVKRISLQNRKTVTGHLENGRVVEHLKTRSRRRLASRATAW